MSAAAVAAVVIAVTSASVPNAALDIANPPSPIETPPESEQPPTQTPPSTTIPVPTSILDGNLLTADQLDEFYFGDTAIEWAPADPVLITRCQPDMAAGTAESGRVTFVPGDSEELQVEQWAEVHETDDAAATRLTELRTALCDCAEADDDVELFVASTITGVGDAGFMADLYEPYPEYAETSIYSTVRAAQTGRVVTWTVYAQVKPEILDASEVAELAVAVERLCGPAGGACVGAPALIRTYPNPDDPGAPGLITAEEVNSALPGRWVTDEVGLPADDVLDVACSVRTMAEAGAVETLGRSFVDTDGPAGSPVGEVRVSWGRFDSMEVARAYVDEQDFVWPGCVIDAVEVVRAHPNVSMWRFDFADHHAYFGFIPVSDHVLVVQWTASDVDDDAYLQLWSRAHERLSRLI